METPDYYLGDYAPGRFGWKLEVVEIYSPPIPAKGSQGLWDWIRPKTKSETKCQIEADLAAEAAIQARLCEVVNIRDLPDGWQYDKRYVYIGRESRAKRLAASIWENPFRIGEGRTREAVIKAYRERLEASPDLLARIHELEGKRLVCWCAPRPCHGDVLAEYVERHVRGRAALR
jgi:hypothetical protein